MVTNATNYSFRNLSCSMKRMQHSATQLLMFISRSPGECCTPYEGTSEFRHDALVYFHPTQLSFYKQYFHPTHRTIVVDKINVRISFNYEITAYEKNSNTSKKISNNY